jgi:hypothetical protein
MTDSAADIAPLGQPAHIAKDGRPWCDRTWNDATGSWLLDRIRAERAKGVAITARHVAAGELLSSASDNEAT